MFDGKAFGQEVVTAVKAHVEKSLGPIVARLDALERQFAALPAPRDGKDGATVDDLLPALREEVAKAAADFARTVPEMISAAVALIPPADNGKDADPDVIKGMVDAAVSAMPATKDGKSVTVDELRPVIDESVLRAISALPAPKNGADAVLTPEMVVEAVKAIPNAISAAVVEHLTENPPAPGKDGRDGLDVTKFIRDEKGHLIGVLRDGTTCDLGEYVGKDGAPGADGKDGFSLDSFDAELMKDGRTVLLKFEQGERAYSVELGIPAMIYRGVFREDQTYSKGDTVTFGGSLWHCDAEPTVGTKPDAIGEHKAWTLCAKKGRDGRDGVVKEIPKLGPVKV